MNFSLKTRTTTTTTTTEQGRTTTTTATWTDRYGIFRLNIF